MNYVLEAMNKNNASKQEKLDFYEEHREAAEWVVANITKKGIKKSPI